MSKIEAYRCDKCKLIFERDEVSGLLDNEALFDGIEHSFKVLPNNPEKTTIHFCLECYRVHVLNPVSNITNRAKDEPAYISVLKEYTYIFKKSIILQTSRDHNKVKNKG